MQTTPSSQNVTIKVIITLILIFIELLLNSFVESSFTLSFQTQFIVNYWFLPIQICVTASIFIMILILMWQTFPLRYGLITTLLKQFKWTFIIVLLFIGFTAAERGIKLTRIVLETNKYTEIGNWQDVSYSVLYYIRFLLYPFYYAMMIRFCIRIINPSFYKPNRWLK